MATGRFQTRTRNPLGLLLCGGALLALAACGSSTGPSGSLPTGGGRYKVGSAYQIKGNWYRPEVDYAYDRVGIASWYGPNFHGRLTANGEIYDMNRISAAHPTLPMPSLVEVTNLQNGRRLTARINDRGPFANNRIIDMSRAAAEELGFRRQGTTRVRVRVLAAESRQMAAAAQGKRAAPTTPTARPTAVSASTTRSSPSIFAAPSQPIASGSTPKPNSAPLTAISSENLAPPLTAARATRPLPQATPGPATPGPATSVPAAVSAPQSAGFPPGVIARPAPVTQAPPTPARVRQAAPRTVAATSSPVLSGAGRRIFVQAGAYTDYGNARRVRGRLADLGGASIESVMIGGRAFHRVRVGPAANQREADRLLTRIQGAGFSAAHLVVDRPL